MLYEKLFMKEEIEHEQDRIDFGQDTEAPY